MLLVVWAVLDQASRVCPNISLSEPPPMLREVTPGSWWPCSAPGHVPEGSKDGMDNVAAWWSRLSFLSMCWCSASLLSERWKRAELRGNGKGEKEKNLEYIPYVSSEPDLMMQPIEEESIFYHLSFRTSSFSGLLAWAMPATWPTWAHLGQLLACL